MDSAAGFLLLPLPVGFGQWGARADQRETRIISGYLRPGIPAWRGHYDLATPLSWRPHLHSGGLLLPVLVPSRQQVVKEPWRHALSLAVSLYSAHNLVNILFIKLS